MNIAEKVLQLKQDFDNVYKAGQESGGGSGDYNQGYEDGKNSVVDNARYAKTITFASLNIFGKAEVELNLESVESLSQFCVPTVATNKNTTVEHLIINCLNLITSSMSIHQCGSAAIDDTLRHITLNVNTQNSTRFDYAFYNNRALETIDGTPLDFSSVVNVNYINGCFTGCGALKEVRFVANSIKVKMSFANSPDLSAETTQSIIDGLADLTGGTAQTLTVHKTVGEKLTDEQKATITAKNWTLVY